MMSAKPHSRLNLALAQFLATLSRLPGPERQRLQNLLADLGSQQEHGHSCILLAAEERDLIMQSGLASNGERTPLVLQHNRLYFQRYWLYENQLAQNISARLQFKEAPDALEAALDLYFPPTANLLPDWQRLAARAALTQRFTVISGGPGTGKTTTVVKILALLQQLAAQPLHVALTAPTGKAAMRLQQAVGANIDTLPCSDAVKALIPRQVTTIHRLLGARPWSPYFYHDADNPLPHDAAVVDEASMVDLALMSKLANALQPHARLLLLGDKDQLASVEAGAVLADLCAAVPANTAELLTAHRFNAAIQRFASAINRQDADIAWQCLHSGEPATTLLHGDALAFIAQQQHSYLEKIRQKAPVPEIFAAFNIFQALCATREGRNGVTAVNAGVEQWLARGGQIRSGGTWYAGRPVMITQNDPNLHLYNGDIGICLADTGQDERLLVYFQRPDGSVKTFFPGHLPPCETVFAMTIHKSQGSEFDTILILLPDTAGPLLTKELLYTAVTRAKRAVTLASSASVFRAAVAQKIARTGGLTAQITPAAI